MTVLLTKIFSLLGILSIAIAAQTNQIAVNPPIIASSTPPSVIDLIEQNFSLLGEKAVKTAIRIATCESRLVETAKNPSSTASGVFQILTGTFKRYSCSGSVMNAEDNIRCAAKIRKVQGNWSDWESSRQCWE